MYKYSSNNKKVTNPRQVRRLPGGLLKKQLNCPKNMIRQVSEHLSTGHLFQVMHSKYLYFENNYSLVTTTI